MNIKRTRIFRAFVLVTLISCYVYLTYGEERPSVVRNVAWNDLVAQIKCLPHDSPQDSFDKELLVIQKVSQSARERNESWNLRPRSVQGH
jgi:hypothetical protein